MFLHIRGQLKDRISGNSRRQVGKWVDTAYALWFQDEVDSGESKVTEEDSSTDSEAGEDTKDMSRENCSECVPAAHAQQ